MQEIRPVVFTQYSRHCIDACAWRLCDLKIIPGNASPDGTGYRGRLTAIAVSYTHLRYAIAKFREADVVPFNISLHLSLIHI